MSSIDTSLTRAKVVAGGVDPRDARIWPAWVILGIAAAAFAYGQFVGVIDNGLSNLFKGVVIAVALLALGIWLVFFSRLSWSTRWWGIAGAVAILALANRLVRVEGFTGNLEPIVHWRWTPDAEAELSAKVLVANHVAGERVGSTSPQASQPDGSHDFSGFLGSHRDAFVPDVKLATDWKSRPPKLVWKEPIGLGYSAFAVMGDAAFTLEQRGELELVTSYDVRTGELRWHHDVKARHHNVIGGDGPGSTPTVEDGRVYALGGTGVLRCLDAASGDKVWMRDVLADVGTNYDDDVSGVMWGRMASPLLVDNLVVVPGGGPAAGPRYSLVAYDRESGQIVWKAGNRQVSYSSPSLANYGGVRQIVIVNEDTISSHDPKSGAVLWETKWDGSSNSSASASQTVQLADDQMFVSKGYSMGGAALFEVKPNATAGAATKGDDGSDWNVTKLWYNHRVLLTKQNNVVVKDDFVYGLSDGVLQCVELNTGKKQWAGDDYGHGQLLRVGDLLLVLGEWGELALVELEPAAFHELAKLQVLEGKTWNNPALAGSLLVIRNAQEAACYEMPLAK
jgi:outer membrane protein assembly factor BamB